MKTLCIYYSRSGSTREIMEKIAAKTGSDIAEYTDGKNRSGVLGFLKSCVDSYKAAPLISVSGLSQPLGEYDRVIIGFPVWAEKPCILAKGFIEQYADKLPKEVYFVITHQSKRDYEKELNALDSLLAEPHKAHLSISTKLNRSDALIDLFVKGLN